MDDWRIFAYEAAAVGQTAIEQGIARLDLSYEELLANATRMIRRSHDLTQMMMDQAFIAECPIE